MIYLFLEKKDISNENIHLEIYPMHVYPLQIYPSMNISSCRYIFYSIIFIIDIFAFVYIFLPIYPFLFWGVLLDISNLWIVGGKQEWNNQMDTLSASWY